MNFKNIISQFVKNAFLNEAAVQVGTSEKKERAKSETGDRKARDAARKRVERSREVPRERKSKQELIKDVILVKTKSGNTQLIFKDSFNKGLHQKLSKDVLTVEEAQQATRSENFEQTRASKLLFGNVKEKETKGKGESNKKASEEKKEREDAKPRSGEEREKEEKTKAKRMSKDQMFQAMTQMTPDQLMGMPPELRAEYFKMARNPPANNDFDRISYEGLTVEFGLSNVSSAPYNQQVLNALVFLAKLKTGASDQEMQTYLALAPDAREFTRSAFFTARKILSQIGDQCLQNLLTNVETTGKPVNAEGAADMACGEYKFKVAAGGEISLSTNDFNQSNKNFKGYVSSALTQALTNPQLIASDPKVAATFQKMQQGKENFSKVLVPDELLPQIMSDPKLVKKLQNTTITSPSGEVVGTVIDEEGNLNQLASLSYYKKAWEQGANELMKGGSAKNSLKSSVIGNLLKTVLRGDNITAPEMAPNHLITVNGILPMTDDYFAEISKQSELDVKPAKDVMTASNITNYKPSSAQLLKTYTSVVEAVQPKKKDDVEGVLVERDSIEPIQLMVNHIVKNNDFLLNASLLPGFSTKDLNSVQYNYVTIGKKTIKIPVLKGENISNEVFGESAIFLNDILIEALTNNFVLTNLVRNEFVTGTEAALLVDSGDMLLENSEYVMINVHAIYENMLKRLHENPTRLFGLIDDFFIEEYKRDYKKEYRNYHGKPKQRKERAARTAARELMKKKGPVKKGDGKDIDHKRPLRNGGSKGINNLRVRAKSENRSDNGHHKGETQNKDSWK
jgi:hypothetical protein